MKFNVQTAILMCCCTTLAATLTVEPSATLLENQQVKVTRALEKPHVKGHFHEHKQNRVMVYLQSGRQRFEYQDGKKPAVFDWKAGEVQWSPAAGMHSPEVISDAPFNIIEVELKAAGTGKTIDGDLDPLKIDPQHYQLEFENDQVRVFRAKVEPHGSIPLHQHPLNRINVFLTDQDFRVTDANGRVTAMKHKAGDVAWGIPTTHREENVSDEPFEVLTVEFKS